MNRLIPALICMLTALVFFGCKKESIREDYIAEVVTGNYYSTGNIVNGKKEIVLKGYLISPNKIEVSDHGFRVTTALGSNLIFPLGGKSSPCGFEKKIYIPVGDDIQTDTAYAVTPGGEMFTGKYIYHPPAVLIEYLVKKNTGNPGELHFRYNVVNQYPSRYYINDIIIEYADTLKFNGFFPNSNMQGSYLGCPTSASPLGRSDYLTFAPDHPVYMRVAVVVQDKTTSGQMIYWSPKVFMKSNK